MNSHFYNLLEKALAKTITEEETFELWDYIDKWESPDVEFLKFACDKKYVPAYSTLGNIYCKGELCPQDWNKAIEYWKKAAAEGDREYLRLDECYINLGDCYRLGNGVEKDFDIAWHYYELAIEYKQERSEYPEMNLLLLETDNGLDPWNMTVSNDWWEYAIEKSGNYSINVCKFMLEMYDPNTERFLFWQNKLVESDVKI